jgi:hypothetical protein
MLQLIEKILLTACETQNGGAAIEALVKLRRKNGNYTPVDDSNLFNAACCHAIHALYSIIDGGYAKGTVEWKLSNMLIDILFMVEKASHLKKYLEIPSGQIHDRCEQYMRIADRNVMFIPHYVKELMAGAPLTVREQYQNGRQLVTIKTVVEQEISMYLDIDMKCPKCVKVYMPHLDEPIYISRVMKKYVKFAKIFDGKAKENTLSYYYKFNRNESVLEFIDEEMETEVADLLGVQLTSTQVVDEEAAMEEASAKNRLTDEQVHDFKKQLEEMRESIHGLAAPAP